MARHNDIAIKVEGVSKTFKLPHEKQSSLKGAFLNTVRQSKGYEVQEALKDVSFEVKKGEFFGIVGRNGSGKSTLLKCMAGVYTPNKGKIRINGTLVPFIELGVGFNPELSGRDNVFLNGALLGFSRKQMVEMYDEIVEFAELEQFMDQKLKNYSSGMQVRLAFSIAIRAKGDVLLLDEVLAVGDSAFQQKCFDYFYRLKKDKRTIILVSHNMKAIEEYCDRALLINNGTIVDIGNPEEIATQYSSMNMESSNKDLERQHKRAELLVDTTSIAVIEKVWTTDEAGGRKTVFGPGETIMINCDIKIRKRDSSPIVELKIHQRNTPAIIAASTTQTEENPSYFGKDTVRFVWSFENNLSNSTYLVRAKVVSMDKAQIYARRPDACRFEVRGWASAGGLVQPDYELKEAKS